MFDKCPACGKRVGTFSSNKKVRCDYCRNEGCTHCFFLIKSSKKEFCCCHKENCFRLFLESIDPFFGFKEILEKIKNDTSLQRTYIDITLRKVKNILKEGKPSYTKLWDCFSFMEYSLSNRLFIKDLQKNENVLADFFDAISALNFRKISEDIQKFTNYNEVLSYFGNILPLKLVHLFIGMKSEKYGSCLQCVNIIPDSTVKGSLRAIFYGLENKVIAVAESGLNSLGMQNINPKIVEVFSEMAFRKIEKERSLSERDLRSSECFLDKIIDLTLKNYDPSKKSLKYRNPIISWYILAKTGAASHLDLDNKWVDFDMGRKVRAQSGLVDTDGWTAKELDLGAYYFYVNSIVCSNKWDHEAAAVVRYELESLAKDMLKGDDDLEKMFQDGLRFIPFGEEAAYALKSVVRKRILFDGPSTLPHFYEDINIDQMTAIHILYFDMGRDTARRYIGLWLL